MYFTAERGKKQKKNREKTTQRANIYDVYAYNEMLPEY